MRRLFFRFYLGVLAVLFMAWYIHGFVLKSRTDADRVRVNAKAHGGGARLVARELDASLPENRLQVLNRIREKFSYPVEIVSVDQLPSTAQRQIAMGDDVFYFRLENGREGVGTTLSGRSEAVTLGPFPDFTLNAIEEAIGGWMRLTAEKIEADPDRESTRTQLQSKFDFPVIIVARSDIPEGPRKRIEQGRDIVFFSPDSIHWFSAISLKDNHSVIQFGPFVSFDRNEQKAAATTLALVLLPAAFAIALLLRPVAWQLRQVENAAKKIASGNLSARVDERRIGSALPLAHAFNHMASRTETLVRTQRELLQAVSHELRTPLSRVRFAIDLIHTAENDSERSQRLASLDTAAQDLDELVDELLRYVRMETAEVPLNKDHVNVKEAFEILIPKHASLNPSIHYDVTGVEDVVVFADRMGFYRALDNLMSNASRFARSKILVHALSNGTAATIDIDDDGKGVAESDRQRVFEPFVRIHDTQSNNGPGVGLGLAIVQRIVYQHGGNVHLTTNSMGGCRARIVWPTG